MSFVPLSLERTGARRYQVWLSFLLIPCLMSSIPENAFGQTGAGKSKSTKTPEERAAEKQRAAEQKAEKALLRRQTFAVIPEADDSQLAKEYRASFEAFRVSLADMDELQSLMKVEVGFNAESRDKYLNLFADRVAVGHVAREAWLRKAGEVYASDPDKYKSMGDSLLEMLDADVKLDRCDPWLVPCKALVESGSIQEDALFRNAGLVALVNQDFDFLEKCWGRLQDRLLPIEKSLLGQVNQMRASWARELEIRTSEDAKGSNPQVELITSKGRMVLELYEDSAPQAVNSFIYLVEKRFYNRRTFFRVEQHTCAQVGCEKGDGSTNAGYTIANEARNENHRNHFHGTVSIALGGNKDSGQLNDNSGSSQIYFSFLPMPQLDGKFTVFGRIVEGQSTLSLFKVMDLSNEEERKDTSKIPDFIHSAKVIRKRDHEYVPEIVAGKLYR